MIVLELVSRSARAVHAGCEASGHGHTRKCRQRIRQSLHSFISLQLTLPLCNLHQRPAVAQHHLPTHLRLGNDFLPPLLNFTRPPDLCVVFVTWFTGAANRAWNSLRFTGLLPPSSLRRAWAVLFHEYRPCRRFV